MNLKQRIQAFASLGTFLGQFKESGIQSNLLDSSYDDISLKFQRAIKEAKITNAWFTEPNIYFALQQWSHLLTPERLETWINPYQPSLKKPKRVAIVMAGNIPMVGFHDLLSVLITGHKALIKQSSNDKVLLKVISECLIHIEPEFENSIQFEENKLSEFDAVIATGSDNTARYFDYYFGKYPNIIRKNRNSVGVITGKESTEDLKLLSNDIFRYYGLGCRNVSKIFVPKDYNFDVFFNAIYDWHPIIHEHKYANNYDYNKAVYLMSEYNILDNGFLILKNDIQFSSPIATLFYEHYEDEDSLYDYLDKNSSHLQCIVGANFSKNTIQFGQTQNPELSTYADNVDTVDFLLKI